MRDLSGTGQVYRFTLSQLLKSRANRVTLIIMVLLAVASMPLTALLGDFITEKTRLHKQIVKMKFIFGLPSRDGEFI